ncbi:MAG TPA: FAD-dependent oxidoreductase [Candidatus Dormibacteraeota bacterium]|nr:FAD-dependent oxidoreductase [Candidatus Dormibacteraeota bacterium]
MAVLNTPWWPEPPDRYPGRLPDKADVLVIGGGIAGTSLLLHLEKRRIDAVLVERGHLASGASGRNAGFLLAGVAANYAEAVRTYGREKARQVWEITNENHDRMVEAARGQEVGHRRLGSATLPSGEEEREQLIESEQLLREDGFQAAWDGRRLVHPRDGEINPSLMVAALARQAREGAIREGVEITELRARRDDVEVRAGEDTCVAGVVILATNAYTSLLVPSVRIQPTRAQMLAAEPTAGTVSDMPTYSHFGYRYWRQLPGGEFLIGGWRDTSMESELTTDAQPTDDIQHHIDEALPALGVTTPVTNRWAGIMGFTESGLPLAGPLEGMPNVYICAGFNGHGMGFAFMTARQVAESI